MQHAQFFCEEAQVVTGKNLDDTANALNTGVNHVERKNGL